MESNWWIDDKQVPADRITRFERTGEVFELHIDYYRALRRPVRIDRVTKKSQSGEPEQVFTVVDQEQILPDEGDGEQEPGLFLKLRQVESNSG